MTTETITREAPTTSGSAILESVEKRSGLYSRLWRSVPRELGFLLLTLPMATVGFAASLALLNAGIATIVTFFIGVFSLIGLLYVGRGFGTLELVRLRWAGRPPITRPPWVAGTGFWGWIKSLLGSGYYWLYALHTSLVNYLVSIVTWTITLTWLAVGLGGVSYWFWSRFLPESPDQWFLSRWLLGLFGAQSATANWQAIDGAIQFVLGVLCLVTLPFVTHSLVLLHDVIARGMLGRFASDELRNQVSDLSAARGAALSAEGQSLRRLERDIHDGPQQRLVRLQMDLAAAERQLDTDPEAARTLLGEAKGRSQEVLDELRALSRGFAPPILLDRGLLAALESLAARNTVPVTVTSALGPDVDLPLEIERNIYFVASELVTNATKHSGATRVSVELAVRRVPENAESWLDITVTDDGHGGAVVRPGHGLAGLDERLRGLGGSLEIVSAPGGPTAVTGRVRLLP